jgi:hypothetical protein
LLNRTSSIVRLMQALALPLLLLAVVPLLIEELTFPLPHLTLASAVADVVYLSHGAFGLVQGHVPYRSGFMTFPDQRITYLYPPLTLLISLPPVLAGTRHYDAAFSIEILLLGLVGATFLGWSCRRLGMPGYIGLAAAVLLLAVGPVLLTRVDAIQGLLVAGSALALMRRRNVTAVLLVSLAVLIKETAVPAALPVVLWCLFPESSQATVLWKRVGKVVAGGLPALAIFTFVLVWSRGAELTASLASVHRGLEIESVPASVAIALSRLMPVHPYLGRLASWQLATGDATVLAAVATVVGLVAVVGGAMYFVWRRCNPATAVAFCVAASLCATPVLSPQYLLLLLPVLALAAVVEFPPMMARRLILLGLAVAILTQAEFPYSFASVVTLSPTGTGLLLARNALLILLAVLLALHSRKSPEPTVLRVPVSATPTVT